MPYRPVCFRVLAGYQMQRLAIMGTKMLRWINGITRCDQFRIEYTPIAETLHERRLRWCGHVTRSNETSLSFAIQDWLKYQSRWGSPMINRNSEGFICVGLRISGLHLNQIYGRQKWRTQPREAKAGNKRNKGYKKRFMTAALVTLFCMQEYSFWVESYVSSPA